MPGLEDRNIRLGCGFQTVEGKGVSLVVLPEATQGELISEEQFTFQAKICDSVEDLQKSLSVAMSGSAGAYAADLGTNASSMSVTESSRFGAYYMMELEYRKARRTLNVGISTLDASTREELESLDCVEKWEEFYRTNGDHVVSSVTYGRKLIIVVSLSHKVRSSQLRRMLEAKVGFSNPSVFQAAVHTKLQSETHVLTEENISGVRIHSFGESKPDYLEEISKLKELKDKISSFVNSEKTQLVQSESGKVQHKPAQKFDLERDKGVIIAYTTCSYIDFLDKGFQKIKDIDTAYARMLQNTNRASRFLETIGLCHGRVNILIRNIKFFLSGHDGAFLLSGETELGASQLLGLLKNHALLLRGIARDVVAEVAGLSEEGRLHRTRIAEAKECLGLLERLYPSDYDYSRDSFQRHVHKRLQLINKFEGILGDKFDIAARLERLQFIVSKIDAERVCVLKRVELFQSQVERQVYPSMRACVQLIKELELSLSFALVSQQGPRRRSRSDAGLTKEVTQFFEDLTQKLTKFSYKNAWIQRLDTLSRDYENLRSPLSKSQANEPISGDNSDLHNILIQLRQVFETLLPKSARSGSCPRLEAEALLAIEKSIDTARNFLQMADANALIEQGLLLKAEVEQVFNRTTTVFAEALEMFCLSPTDQSFLNAICREHVRETEEKESSEQWWVAHWAQLSKISKDLDDVVSNKIPDSAPPIAIKVCHVIDFRHEAYLVGSFEMKRGKWFKDQFESPEFQKIKIPITTRLLRFALEGDHLPKDVQMTFDLKSKPKVLFDEHKSPHDTLYHQITTGDPIFPLEKSMQEVANILVSRDPRMLSYGEALMHDRNETRLFRKVRVCNAKFQCKPKKIPAACKRVTINIFAQMGNGLDPLMLPDVAPKGHADYGGRFRSVGSANAMAGSDDRQQMRLGHTLSQDHLPSLNYPTPLKVAALQAMSTRPPHPRQGIFPLVASSHSSSTADDEESVERQRVGVNHHGV